MAVSLGVAALSSVGFLADRIQAGLERDARQLLGGDAVLVSDHAFDPATEVRVKQFGVTAVTTLSFPTMARHGSVQTGSSRLVALKVVSEGYPLRGQLQILPPANAPVDKPALVAQADNGTPYDRPGVVTHALPRPGEVWVEPGLLEEIGRAHV